MPQRSAEFIPPHRARDPKLRNKFRDPIEALVNKAFGIDEKLD